MPTGNNLDINIEYSSTIKHKLAEESKLHNQSQTNRYLVLKTKLNRVIKALKLKNFEKKPKDTKHLSKLSPIAAINYSL